MRTLGGRQFWGDVCFFHGYRIQQNSITKHYRLLDPKHRRLASGTLDACEAALEDLKKTRNLPKMSGKAVVLIHGIVRTSRCFSKLVGPLKDAGYTPIPFEYPSTRVDIALSAEYLSQLIDSLEGIEEIDLVVHSMGGLVVRSYLQNGGDERIHRMVMLGVPNQGAHMADRLQRSALFRLVFGPAGKQLAIQAGYADRLPIPTFEFGVIAGNRGTPGGYNPLIPGDDDGTVSVESTKLPGAADFLTVPCLHTFMMRNADVIAATLRFLESGEFRKEGGKQPIPAGPAPAEEPQTAAGEPATTRMTNNEPASGEERR